MKHLIFLVALLISACVPQLGTKDREASGKSESPSSGGDANYTPPADTPSVIVEKESLSVSGGLNSRRIVADVLSEVFTSSTYPISNLEGLLRSKILTNPSSFGLACDPYGSYGTRDCGGSVISAVSVGINTEASTVRQLGKTYICETLLSMNNNGGIRPVAEKVAGLSGGNLVEINDDIIRNTFSLFFKHRAIKTTELDAYRFLNESLKAKTPAVTLDNRWRLLILIICESPEWEALP